MNICAYWDCASEIDEEMSFCHEHGLKMDKGLIDQCPRCGRYKDKRYTLCPDCRYGRPIADWKISSRTVKTGGYAQPEHSEKWDKKGLIMYSRGEARCPSCGSSNLVYKSVFEYFKCNKCKSTFITPVYNHAEDKERLGTESTKDLTRKIFAEAQLERQEEKEGESSVNVSRERKPTNTGWVILLLTLVIVIIIAAAVWALFGNQIEDLLGGVL